jgi:molybdate transport system ATP-binding protein
MANQLTAEISKTFPSGARVDVKLVVDLKNEPVQVIFGPSGSGKSTILRSIAGFEKPEIGLIRFGDETWLDTRKRRSLRPQKRQISYLSQKPALFPHLNVLDNIRYALDGLPEAEADARVQELVAILEIQDLESRYPKELSGGQQQRVSLARALSVKPRLVLLDEPFSAVDQPMKHILRLKFRELFKTLGIPVFIVTHDPVEAASLGHRVHLIDQGKILQSELSGEIFRKPNSIRSAEILGFENFLKDGKSVNVIRADEVILSNTDGAIVQVQESISEGAVVRIILKMEDGKIITSIQPHSRFPGALPHPGARFRAVFPQHPIRFHHE